MEMMALNWQSCFVSEKKIVEVGRRLAIEIEKVQHSIEKGYDTEYGFVNLPDDTVILKQVKSLCAEKNNTLKIKAVVVIGIGGSSLGTIAVHEALNGVLYNEKNPEIALYFVDTIDSDYLASILKLVERRLMQGEDVLVNVVTKSGTTTETIVNFEIFLQLLKKHRPTNYFQHIVVTSDRDSQLWNYAQKNEISTLEIPKRVGGRFSVLSPVGLFPLVCVGVDIELLCAGAASIVEFCVTKDIADNPAVLSAVVIFAQYLKGCAIHDTFIFSREMRAVGDWYRQLVGESLGKKENLSGQFVHVGITPTVSIGTNDLHSIAQLHFGGPRDKFTTFVMLGKSRSELAVPDFEQFEPFVENIQGKSVFSILQAIVSGTKSAYRSENLPFISIELPELSPFYLGQFLQMKMLEIVYLGHLLDVNPFNQPQVELYKKETRRALLQ